MNTYWKCILLFFCALLIKLIALIAIFAGILPIWLAVLSDTGMAVVVTLNALRLLMKKDTN